MPGVFESVGKGAAGPSGLTVKWWRKEMDISFIIPVYNGEESMERCLQSICRWDWKADIEIVVVDDGSTDGTALLCQNYAASDHRIRIFPIENSGQSIARNYGMKQCCGTYLCFVDADDKIHPEEMFHMWEIAKREKADVVMGAYFRVNGTQKERIHLAGEGLMARNGNPKEEALYHQVMAENAFGYVWNKLYRKAFLDRNHLQMDDIRKIYMEDQLFNLKVWSKHPIWYCYDRPVYDYETQNVSTTRKAEPMIHAKNIAMIHSLISYYEENHILEENLDVLVPLIMRTFCWSLVKNIRYEGMHTANIRQRARAYMCSESIQRVIRMKGAVGKLWKLPSLLQTLFYSACLVLIRWRWSGFVTLLFDFTYPVMHKYIVNVVK